MNAFFAQLLLFYILFLYRSRGIISNKRIMLLVGSSLIAILGLRSVTVGIDMLSYIPAYQSILNYDVWKGITPYNFEVGFSIYNWLLASLGAPEYVFVFFTAIIIILPRMISYYKNSNDFLLSAYIFMTLGFYTFSFSGLRQAIAMGLTIYSYTYIKERKLVKFLIIIFIAISFHKSSIIFIIAYFLYGIKLKQIYFPVFVIMLAFVYVFRIRLLNFMYMIYKGRNAKIVETGAITTLIFMLIILLVFFVFKVSQNSERVNTSFEVLLLFIAACIQILSTVDNDIMRMGYYFYEYIVFLLPNLIRCIKFGKNRVLAYVVVLLFLFLFILRQLIQGSSGITPYYFFWQ